MFKRLIVAMIVLMGLVMPSAFALDPLKVASIVEKVMKANVARPAAAGRVHKGAVILTNEQVAATEAAALINRARISSKIPIKVASAIADPSRGAKNNWLAVAVALGATMGVLTHENQPDLKVTAQVDGADVMSFKTELLSPWALPPIVTKPVLVPVFDEINFNNGMFATRPFFRARYSPPHLYRVGVTNFDNPVDSQSIFDQHYKNLPASGYVLNPFGSVIENALDLVRVESPVIHCNDPAQCLSDFVQSGQNKISQTNAAKRIYFFTSDLLLVKDDRQIFSDYQFSYSYNYQYTDLSGGSELEQVDTQAQPKIGVIRRLTPKPAVYADPVALLEEAPHVGQAEVSPELLADLLNRLWRKTQTMQETQTYDESFPVTRSDIETAIAPRTVTIAELLRPSQDLAEDDPCAYIVNECKKPPKNDFGNDPVIPPPTLEDIPTVPMILDPIFNLLPSLKRYRFTPSTQCPVAEFDALGRHFVVNQHCDLSENSRALWAMFAAACWSFVVLRVVLKS